MHKKKYPAFLTLVIHIALTNKLDFKPNKVQGFKIISNNS